MDQPTGPPTAEAIHTLLQEIAPGSTALAIEPLPGSYSNFTHLIWELAATARPMFNPQGWITGSPAKEEFRAFIADARRRCGAMQR